MQVWQQYMAAMRSAIMSFGIEDFADIAILAALAYKLLTLTWKTSAKELLKGVVVMLIVWGLSVAFHMRVLNWIITSIFNSGVIVIVILFQDEIRRALKSLGSANLNIKEISQSDVTNNEHIVTEITNAMLSLSKRKVGALIVLARTNGLQDVIENNGTPIDAVISKGLIENTFEPNTPLHDGAMVISEGRIIAAACILNLSDEKGIDKELGTRHRAAIGVTERTDAMALIVSEETGIISVATGGKLTRHLDEASLRAMLIKVFPAQESAGLLSSLLSGSQRTRKKERAFRKEGER